MSADPYRVTQEDAVAFTSCPACKQPAGSMCVYMPVAYADEYSDRPGVRAKLDRVGSATKVVHPERRQVVRERRWESEQLKRAKDKAPVVPPPRELLEAHRAGVAWDRQEYVKLYQWLATWGRVLFN